MHIFPQDTVKTTPLNNIGEDMGNVSSGAKSVRPHQKSVAEVLSWLPKDATPAQQDSAVQAYFVTEKIVVTDNAKAEHAKNITWFETTLSGQDAKGVFIKTGWREPNFLDSLPSGTMYQEGFSGDPVNYRFRDDEFVTTPLVISFFLAAFMIAKSWDFFRQNLSLFFGRSAKKEHLKSEKTGKEFSSQLFFIVFTCLLFSTFFFGYTHHYITEVYNQVSPYKILSFYFFTLITFFSAKFFIYHIVNSTFFHAWQSKEWNETYLFYVFFVGLVLMPLTLMLIFVDIDFQFFIIALICLLGVSKILLFYRCKSIFFRKWGAFFHLFLYFCTLELLPTLTLWRFLLYMNYKLITDF